MRSDAVKKGVQQAPHRSLFNALGFTKEEMERPLVGIVSSYNEIVPGHFHLRGIADALDKIRLLGPLPEKMREALRKKYGSPDYNALDAEMRKTFVKLVSTDLTGRLGEVKAPTLLLWGTNDTETPLWMGRIMEKSIPDCALVELKGGSHFAFLEQLGFFCQVLEQYFYGGTTA